MDTVKQKYPILEELRADTSCKPYSEQSQAVQELLSARVAMGLGISELHAHMGFDGRYPAIERELRNIADPRTGGVESCLLSGPTGTGKTACLSAMFKHRFHIVAMQSGLKAYLLADWVWSNVVYLTYSEFCQIIRDRDGEMPLTWDNLSNCSLLMLDDLGFGFSDAAGWNLTRVSELLDKRWRGQLKTWMTTNLSGAKRGAKPSDLEQWIGDRSFSRIADRLWMAYYELTGADRRREPPVRK